MTLARKLFASYVLLVVLSAVTLVVAADRSLKTRLLREATVEVARETTLLAGAVDGLKGARLDSLVRRLGRETGRRLTVIDTSGLVIADTDFPTDELSALENHATRPEFRAALAGGTGTDLRRSVSTGRWELKVAMPTADGAVRVSTPLPQVDAVVRDAQQAVLLGALLALAVGALLALGFARAEARPLVRLRDAAVAMARGQRPAIDARGQDEIGDLARALRFLDDNLNARMSELERERSEMQALIASMVEGVIGLDAGGAVTTLNPAARVLLKLAPDAAPPRALELFRQRAAREAVERALRGEAGGADAEPLEVEMDGRTVLLSGHSLPGAEGGAVLVLHDITGLKRLEAVRRDFVANVSHELKTPLTVIRGYAETLAAADTAQELRRDFLEKVLANARRMQQLVDDLLDLSRVESGAWEPRPERAAVRPILEEVWAALKPRADAAGLGLEVDIASGAETVCADPRALRQVLANVLDNAVRYSPGGGTIAVHAFSSGHGLTLEVSDPGIGISGEHLPRIFERFYRVDAARSRQLGGTGLGLAIVKHLVEAHGGRVSAESALGAGTKIRITLPDAGSPGSG